MQNHCKELGITLPTELNHVASWSPSNREEMIAPPPSNAAYSNKVFTPGPAGFPGYRHIDSDSDGHKDFSALIEVAKTCQPAAAGIQRTMHPPDGEKWLFFVLPVELLCTIGIDCSDGYQ